MLSPDEKIAKIGLSLATNLLSYEDSARRLFVLDVIAKDKSSRVAG
jgi:hypothetical protein